MDLIIREATVDELLLVSRLAEEAYWSTYSDILSKEQIVFMLANIYSILALQEAMGAGQRFYIAYDQGVAVGFIGVKPKEQSILRVEKLYLLSAAQGKGYGKMLIDHAIHIAEQNQAQLLELNVNRGNPAYYFYLKQGFKVIEEVDIPYHGFVLDDYIMQKQIVAET